ncbi:hypothetical protein JL720_13341 [Aureococcus anophagefferens]|nr:hypothetical protein JL720_13341 [Aureococcus anophagefferens]
MASFNRRRVLGDKKNALMALPEDAEAQSPVVVKPATPKRAPSVTSPVKPTATDIADADAALARMEAELAAKQKMPPPPPPPPGAPGDDDDDDSSSSEEDEAAARTRKSTSWRNSVGRRDSSSRRSSLDHVTPAQRMAPAAPVEHPAGQRRGPARARGRVGGAPGDPCREGGRAEAAVDAAAPLLRSIAKLMDLSLAWEWLETEDGDAAAGDDADEPLDVAAAEDDAALRVVQELASSARAQRHMAPHAAASHDRARAAAVGVHEDEAVAQHGALTPQAFSSARTAVRGGFLAFFGAGAAFMVVCCVAEDRRPLTDLDARELTFLINELRAARGRRRGDGRRLAVREGRDACERAIADLKAGGLALWPYEFDATLSEVAKGRLRAYVDDPASLGDGAALARAVEAAGEWSGGLADCVVDGEAAADEILHHLVVGDGDPERRDRANLLSVVYRRLGLALCSYETPLGDARTVASLVFASAFEPHPPLYEAVFGADSARFLGLQLAARQVAGPAAGREAAAIRNGASLGGNLATASPISDMNPLLAGVRRP